MTDLDDIHRRHDGTIPAALRAAIRAGGWARLNAARAESSRRLFDRLALGAVRGSAARRGRVGADRAERDFRIAALQRDLRFYRECGVERV
ncbi:MAG: hypothetical protein FJX42_04770 [Alphaproteobacteria bacterium]|nr:hypothetical protein [Alphaproteobacteria bacterium]